MHNYYCGCCDILCGVPLGMEGIFLNLMGVLPRPPLTFSRQPSVGTVSTEENETIRSHAFSPWNPTCRNGLPQGHKGQLSNLNRHPVSRQHLPFSDVNPKTTHF